MYNNFDNSLVHYYPMAVMLFKDVVLVLAMTIVILITPASSLLYFSSPNLTTWINAKKVYFFARHVSPNILFQFCLENDGFLVEIKNQSQEEKIQEYWFGLSQDRETPEFWLGLNDLVTEGMCTSPFIAHCMITKKKPRFVYVGLQSSAC